MIYTAFKQYRIVKPILQYLFFLIMINQVCIAQNNNKTKIYIYSSRPISLKTIQNIDKPIQITYYTLIETDLDSLGFKILPNKIVNIPIKSGQTYYFRTVGSGTTSEASITASTELEFWLNVSIFGSGKYRYYKLDKKNGLVLLSEQSK